MKSLVALLLFAIPLLTLSFAAAPTNDNFDTATVIPSVSSDLLIGTIAGATDDTVTYADGTTGTLTIGQDVWYAWTAPISGKATLQFSAGFPPFFLVYTGTQDNVTEISSDFTSVNFSTESTFDVVGGQTYYIVVSPLGFTPDTPDFTLTLILAPDAFADDFANSTQLGGTSVSVTGTNTSATAETNEPDHVSHVASQSVWLQWTAPSHGSVTISTANSNFDTLLSVYKGTTSPATIDTLKTVAENDNASFLVKTSEVTFMAEDGVTYYIAIDDTFSQPGYINLALDFTATAPSITTKPKTQIVFRGSTATFTLVASGTGTPSYQWQRAAAADPKTWTNLTDGVVSNLSAADDGVDYEGSTTDTLTVATTAAGGVPTNNDLFRCIVTDTNGSTTSASAKLTVTVLDTVPVTVRGAIPTIDLTNGAGAPASGTIYYVKGLPKGLSLDPSTGLTTGTATAKPGTYTVTYGTQTGKIKTDPLTILIVVDPLDAGLSGGFEAILENSGLPVGKVELLVNASTGAFTGKLTCADAKTYALKGSLTLNGTYDQGSSTLTISPGKGLDPYNLVLTIDETQPADQVLSAIWDQMDAANTIVASTLGQSSSGVQLATYTTASPTPWQGSYTLILDDPTTAPIDAGVTTPPEGTGFGTVTIKAVKGLFVFKGKLGDGTTLTASLAPSSDGSYRWYGKPYKTGGYFGGWLLFQSIPGGGVAPYQMVGTADSDLFWEKADTNAVKDKSYRTGFGPIEITATSQLWTKPTTGVLLSTLLQAASFTPTFSANLPVADTSLVPSTLILNGKNQVVVTVPIANADKFAAKVTTSSGLFTASLTLNDKRKVTVSGVMLQQPGTISSGAVIGEGVFLVPPLVKGAETVSGKIQFVAP